MIVYDYFAQLNIIFGWDDLPVSSLCHGASLVTQAVKSLPAVWETQVWSLVQEDPPEKEMVTHSTILAWKILQTEEPGHRVAKSQTRLNNFTFTFRRHYDSNIRKPCYRKCTSFLRCHSEVSQTGDLKKKNLFTVLGTRGPRSRFQPN